MKPDDIPMETFYARTRDEWRSWLDEHCQLGQSIWLIIYQKKSVTPSVRFRDAIEEAVCFGWVDSKAVKRDEESFLLHFTPRNPKSTWGKTSRERAERLIAQGLMTPFGQAAVDHAKQTGAWDALIDAQNSVIPPDLQALFDQNELAFNNFQAFPDSSKRAILEWIMRAKKAETRQARMTRTVELAENNIRANM